MTAVEYHGVMQEHAHSHPHGHGHSHGPVDPSILTSERGIWAVKWSLVLLGITAAVQVVVVLLSGRGAVPEDEDRARRRRRAGVGGREHRRR